MGMGLEMACACGVNVRMCLCRHRRRQAGGCNTFSILLHSVGHKRRRERALAGVDIIMGPDTFSVGRPPLQPSPCYRFPRSRHTIPISTTNQQTRNAQPQTTPERNTNTHKLNMPNTLNRNRMSTAERTVKRDLTVDFHADMCVTYTCRCMNKCGRRFQKVAFTGVRSFMIAFICLGCGKAIWWENYDSCD